MEILSYVLSGKLAHKDSMGNAETLGPNEIQRMSAGAGVIHSEYNGSDTEEVHFLQIWIEPDSIGNPPSYEQYKFEPEEKRNRWKMLASNKPEPGAVFIRHSYFHSIYFREPGGVLFELATDPPGFGLDEPAESLGQSLRLPAWLEPHRSQIEAVLPKIVDKTAQGVEA